jgi:hypothetical protein
MILSYRSLTIVAFIAAISTPAFAQDDAIQVASAAKPIYAGIRIIDAETGAGVPLVELGTVNHLRFVTDSAGRVAINEPGLLGREIHFTVRSHGYEMKKDGFGYAGVRITPVPGTIAEVKITRRNIAERLCRLTGEGRYRDTLLLGLKPPLAESANPGMVAGQDSVQAVPYKGQILWFWGDTARMSYPLGLFRTAGARTPLPAADFNPSAGIAFDYFVDTTGFARAMIPLPERSQGVIWIDGVCTVPDASGVEKLVAHYSRRKGLAEELEQGIAVFNDAKAIFEPVKELPLSENWRFPHGHPELFEEGGTKWLLNGNPALNVRVPATLAAVLDPAKYEAFTAAAPDKSKGPNTDAVGHPVWRWQADLPPAASKAEANWIKTGALKKENARFYPANKNDANERIVLHNGSVRWNDYRKRWIMILGQVGGKSSHLGEVWYAEAEHPTGPFPTAIKVVTHEKQSFYNVCHHSFLDQAGGRTIYFEGPYTADFSGNPERTPRYEYNQVLYKLDLSAVKSINQ